MNKTNKQTKKNSQKKPLKKEPRKKEHNCYADRQNEQFVITWFHVAPCPSEKPYASTIFLYEFCLLSVKLFGTVL